MFGLRLGGPHGACLLSPGSILASGEAVGRPNLLLEDERGQKRLQATLEDDGDPTLALYRRIDSDVLERYSEALREMSQERKGAGITLEAIPKLDICGVRMMMHVEAHRRTIGLVGGTDS
jgi:hypothetical protein